MVDKDAFQEFVDGNYQLLVEDFVALYRDEFNVFCTAEFDNYMADKGEEDR